MSLRSAPAHVKLHVATWIGWVVHDVGKPVERPFIAKVRIGPIRILIGIALIVHQRKVDIWAASRFVEERSVLNVQADQSQVDAVTRHSFTAILATAPGLIVTRLAGIWIGGTRLPSPPDGGALPVGHRGPPGGKIPCRNQKVGTAFRIQRRLRRQNILSKRIVATNYSEGIIPTFRVNYIF